MPGSLSEFKKLNLIRLLSKGVSASKIAKQLRIGLTSVYDYKKKLTKVQFRRQEHI